MTSLAASATFSSGGTDHGALPSMEGMGSTSANLSGVGEARSIVGYCPFNVSTAQKLYAVYPTSSSLGAPCATSASIGRVGAASTSIVMAGFAPGRAPTPLQNQSSRMADHPME